MQGADLQVGRELFRTRYVDMRSTLGAYYFGGPSGKDATGGLLKVSMRITPYFTLEGQGSYDRVFKTNGWGAIALNIPFGPRKKVDLKNEPCASKVRIEERFVEAVDRFEIVVANKYRQKAVALNPVTGLPIQFIFVDNVRGSSNGTFEHPYATLLEAQAHSVPGDTIYVFPGDGTTRGMDQGITLQNYQTFTSSALPIAVSSAFGNQTIPAQTSTMPIIANNNSGGNTVTANALAGVTIQGFQISGMGLGIEAEFSSGILITKNTFILPLLNGIDVTSSTNALINQNILTGALNLAINGLSSTNLAMNQNIFSGAISSAISSPSSTNLTINQNNFLMPLPSAIAASGSTNLSINQNNFSSSVNAPIDATDSVGITINQNQLSSFPNGAINITGTFGNITISRNSINSGSYGVSKDDLSTPTNTLNASITNNQITITGAGATGFMLTTVNAQGSINFSNNNISLDPPTGLGAVGVNINNAGTSTLDVSINSNVISSVNTSNTNSNTGISYINVGSTLITLNVMNNLVTDMSSAGFSLGLNSGTPQAPGPNSALYANIVDNQFLRVSTSGTPNGGVVLEMLSTTTGLNLSGNVSTTDPMGNLIGYYLVGSAYLNTNVNSPTANLVGLASINSGSTDGPDVAGFKSGSVKLGNSFINFNLPINYQCNCPP